MNDKTFPPRIEKALAAIADAKAALNSAKHKQNALAQRARAAQAAADIDLAKVDLNQFPKIIKRKDEARVELESLAGELAALNDSIPQLEQAHAAAIVAGQRLAADLEPALIEALENHRELLAQLVDDGQRLLALLNYLGQLGGQLPGRLMDTRQPDCGIVRPAMQARAWLEGREKRIAALGDKGAGVAGTVANVAAQIKRRVANAA